MMLAATTTLAMLITNTVAAPVTVNMGDLLEATKVDAFGKHHLWFSAIDASITSSALSVCPPSRVERESCATLVGLRLTKCMLTCGMAISMAAYNTRVHPKARRPTTRRGAAK